MSAALVHGPSASGAPPALRFALAPMDGVTDHVYRELFTARAWPGRIAFAVSEFVRVADRPLSAKELRRACPEMAQGGTTRAGVPVLLQLLGGKPEPLAMTARTAVAAGAYGVDLNFGCPAKVVNRHDGGASLLKAPERIERIVASVRSAVPASHSVSAKIRLGWECHDDVAAIALAAERGGASFVTVHGRTKCEMYGPPADWASIGNARRALGVPTVANGDLNSAGALLRCRQESGCNSFMLGRGPMGRPSLFTGEAGEVVTAVEKTSAAAAAEVRMVRDLLLEYLERMSEAEFTDGLRVARVKQWLSLGTKVNPDLRLLFDSVKRLSTPTEVKTALLT